MSFGQYIASNVPSLKGFREESTNMQNDLEVYLSWSNLIDIPLCLWRKYIVPLCSIVFHCVYLSWSNLIWRFFIWHNDSNEAVKDVGSLLAGEDYMQGVFSLQIRVSVLLETNLLVVKISQKDNAVELYKRACNIFSVESGLLHIWDFSGQTTQFFINDRIDHRGQPEEEEELTAKSNTMKRIGFIGLGAMGFGMATHLRRSNLCVLGYDGITFEFDDDMVVDDDDREALQDIINNTKLSEGYLNLAHDIEVMEPKSPKDIYKRYLCSLPSNGDDFICMWRDTL